MLNGKTIVVTRPAAQAGELCAAITAAGGTVLAYPLLSIVPPQDPTPLTAAIAAISAFDLAIFISPNAVSWSVPAIQAACTMPAISGLAPWPTHLRCAAVGQGTVRRLASYGLHDCLAPTTQFDSESLLALPELAAAHVAGKRIALFKGEGGRDLLAQTLSERGASVIPIPCYRRLGPPLGIEVLLNAWEKQEAQGEQGISALTISSSEGLRYLWQALPAAGQAYLQQTPIFVPHQRIAEQAAALGLTQVILTAPADAGILAGLMAWANPSAA